MRDTISEIANKILSEIGVSPYMDKVLLELVQKGYWSEITIDYYPNQNVINLKSKPYAVVHHGRILGKDLLACGAGLNTIEYVKPYIEYLGALFNEEMF